MSDSTGKKKALGRGLGALLENPSDERESPVRDEYASGNFRFIRIDQIEANPFQPRSQFTEPELRELAESIRMHGIIQPLTLRKIDVQKYQLISGERRLRAAILAELTDVPAYIRIANDEQMLEMALVENIQREELNPLEIAISYQRLLEECHLRQEELSQKVGKDRSTISNYIRLLRLPHEIQVAVRDNLITMGHARALINLEDEKAQLVILRSILEQKASVRQVEEMVRTIGTGAKKSTSASPALPEHFRQGRESLQSKLQTTVELKVNGKGNGRIIIPFRSKEEFEKILSKLDS